jgi:hypothetical protein
MNTMKMTRLPRFTPALVLGLLLIAIPSARAQLVFTFDQPLLTGTPGDTLTFSGTITNTGPTEVFLNGDIYNLTNVALALDDSLFLSNFPVLLASGEIASGEMFTVFIGPGAVSGIYAGSFTIQGGPTDTSLNDLATQSFSVGIAGAAAPEPASVSLLLMLLGAGLTGLRLRERSRQRA